VNREDRDRSQTRQCAIDPVLVAGRRAVAALFVLNAIAYSNVIPRLPAIKDDLGLSNSALGAAVAAMPVGALLSGPLGGWSIERFGSARVAVTCAVALGVVAPAFAFVPAWWALAVTFLLLGAADSLMDVSMNAHALRVQRSYGRSIINAMHGLWSIGAVAGGTTGAVAAGAGLRLGVHLVAVGVVVVVAALSLRPWLLRGKDPPPDASDVAAGPPRAIGSVPPGRAARLAVLGVLVVMAALIEDTPASWGAVFLRSELGASAATAGTVFVAFQVFMTVGRLAGDRIVDRFGEVTVIRSGGLLIAGGMGAGLAIGTPVAVIAGFAVAGLGAAPLFPLMFNAAAAVPGVPTGHGLAAIAWMGRVGFLVSPPLVGLIGDTFSLRRGLAVAPLAGVVVVLLAPRVTSSSRATAPVAP
jgi:MFS family permease